MTLKTLDTFTFMFFVEKTKNTLEKRETMLSIVRSFINTVDSFRGSAIKIKPKRISIENKDFYFAFDLSGVFNMGFTAAEDKIDLLNSTMNEVCAKFTEKMSHEEKMEVLIYSSGDYIIDKKCNLFAKLVQDQNLHKACYQNGLVKPTRIDLECRGKNSNNSIEVSLYREEGKENKLRITLFKDKNKEFVPNAVKDAAETINEMASRIFKELISET